MMALQLSEDRMSLLERRKQIIDGLHELPKWIKEILETDKDLRALAEKTLLKEKSLLIMGRGWQNATCLEGALKIKEISYMHSEGILAGELKHGPLALIDENMPVIIVMTKDSLFPVRSWWSSTRNLCLPLFTENIQCTSTDHCTKRFPDHYMQ